MEIDRTIMLENQKTPDNYHELYEIANSRINKSQIAMGGILSTLIDCYNYGVIMGKREERAKNKKNMKQSISR